MFYLVELFLQQLESGHPPDRSSFLAEYPEIADELSAQSGVTARAHTEMVLTGLRNDDAGTPLEVVVNGVTITGVTSLNELADAITANAGLAGIRARSAGRAGSGWRRMISPSAAGRESSITLRRLEAREERISSSLFWAN